MIQNKNQRFLSSEQGLTNYLNQLRQCTKSLDNKIRQEKHKAHELLFNISTLFGIPTTRNKIDQQMTKVGVIIPLSKKNESQLDQIVRKTVQKNTEEALQDTNITNRQFKRSLQIGQDQFGLIPKKKRHLQFQNKSFQKSYERYKNQSNSSQNISSKQNIEKINSSAEN